MINAEDAKEQRLRTNYYAIYEVLLSETKHLLL